MNGSDPAFTQQHRTADKNLNYGLTKREEFAKAAMQGNLACPNRGYNAETLAKDSLRYADALIAELSK